MDAFVWYFASGEIRFLETARPPTTEGLLSPINRVAEKAKQNGCDEQLMVSRYLRKLLSIRSLIGAVYREA